MVILNAEQWDDLSLVDAFCVVAKKIRDDFPIEDVKTQIDELTAQAKQKISQSPKVHQNAKIEQLVYLFYQTWGFSCADGVYRLSDAIWLDHVLDCRKGTPAALGIIFQTVAERLQLPVAPAIFPTQLLLKINSQFNQQWGLNPANGEWLALDTLKLWYEGYYGYGVDFDMRVFCSAKSSQVIYTVLNVLKNAFMHEHCPELALAVNQLMLSVNPDDPYILRDRGLIFAQLDCDHLALNDLHEFVTKCPDDPVTDVVKMQMKSLKNNSVILH